MTMYNYGHCNSVYGHHGFIMCKCWFRMYKHCYSKYEHNCTLYEHYLWISSDVLCASSGSISVSGVSCQWWVFSTNIWSSHSFLMVVDIIYFHIFLKSNFEFYLINTEENSQFIVGAWYSLKKLFILYLLPLFYILQSQGILLLQLQSIRHHNYLSFNGIITLCVYLFIFITLP